MKAPHSPARDWTSYLFGIAVESAYVAVLLGVAGLLTWLVTRR